MLDKLRNIMWFDWLIIFGIGLLVFGLGLNWKVENKGKIEILVKEMEEIEVFDDNDVLGIESENNIVVSPIPTKYADKNSKDNSVSQTVNKTEISKNTVDGKININKAGIEELTKLSGVGPKTAEKIIEYRTINKGFMNIQEIKLVKGIGDKMYEKIKNNLEI